MSGLKRLCYELGGQTILAKLLGVSRARVWNWINRDAGMPIQYVMKLEKIVCDDSLRFRLRPDLYK
jgi:DNA-binding transcriptional regulator YdaS (Cro superfamily)